MALIIEGTITNQGTDPKYRHKTGPAKGLQMAEIRVSKKDTQRLPNRHHSIAFSALLLPLKPWH
jgi:hypothetical protein